MNMPHRAQQRPQPFQARPGHWVALRHTAIAAAVLGASTAFAQDAGPVPAAATSDDPVANAGQLQEVVITAQKRVQSAQKTPLVISVVSGDEIAAKGQNSVDAVLRNVPGVEVQGLAQGAQVFIRGVGSTIDPSFADPAVALMVDGAYLGRTESLVGGTYDIDRVEVLSGPQGTLYGRNAAGGVINILTANPVLEKRSGFVRGQVGDFGLRRGEGMFNLPLNDELALRFAGFREKRDGYLDDGAMDADSWGARLKLLYRPNSDLSVVAKVESFREKGKGANTVPVPGSAGNLTFPPTIFASNFDPTIVGGPPFTGGAPIWRFPKGWITASSSPWANDSTHLPGYIERSADSVSLQIEADLGFATLTVLPAYTKEENTISSNFLFGTLQSPYGLVTVPNTYRSLETRLASPATSPTKWLLGAYYLDIGGGFGDAQTSGDFSYTQQYLPSRTVAVFGQVTQPVTEKLRMTAGLRYSRDRQGQEYSIINEATGFAFSQAESTSGPSSQYKAGVEYDVAKNAMAYAHVATGFKQGGLSPTIPAIPFDPEKLKTYEAGLKSRFLNNMLQVNASVFSYTYNNYQVTYLQVLELGNTGATLNFPTVTNTSTPGRNRGAELGVDWKLTRDDRVKAAFTYLNAKYGRATLPNNPFFNQGAFQLEGRVMQNSPKWTANLGYEHVFDVNGAEITAGINTKLSTGYYVSAEQYIPGAYQAGFSRTDLSVRYMSPDDTWSVGLAVKNLEDKAQTTYVFPAYRRFVTAPRTLALSAEMRF